VVILDIDKSRLRRIANVQSVLNDLLIYFNVFVNSSCDHRINVVCGRRVVYDSRTRELQEFLGKLARMRALAGPAT